MLLVKGRERRPYVDPATVANPRAGPARASERSIQAGSGIWENGSVKLQPRSRSTRAEQGRSKIGQHQRQSEAN